MAKAPDPRKRRTRGHVIADLSVNHLERFILECGFTAQEPKADYGYDLEMTTYDARGYPEGSLVLFQLKATDALPTTRAGVVYDLDVRDYTSWVEEAMPVFLVVYDAVGRDGYWVYVQGHFAADPARRPKPGRKTVRVTMPRTNVVGVDFIRYARDRKADVLAQFAGRVDHRA